MDASDLAQLESSLSESLPDYYRATMLAYPFKGRMDIEQAELLNELSLLLEVNRHTLPGISKPVLVIGTDQSEETYYIRLGATDSAVYCFELETRNHRTISASWSDYLARCRAELEEAEQQERLESAAPKKWWQQLW